jgi:DNA-binding FadR family transcriptional regulator
MTNRRLFWKIVERIETAISSGEYPPSSRLPPERELAELFSVSRPTIREAIIALEVREKVEVKIGSGVYVIDNEQSNSRSRSINAFELTQARALVEGEVAAIAATSITAEQLASLNQTLLDMKNNKDVEEADRRFHQIIADSTKNKAMILSVNNLWALRSTSKDIIADYKAVCSSDNNKTIDEHNAIYQALKCGDAAKARQAMHKHFNRLINNLFDAVESKALEDIRRRSSEKRDQYSIENLVKPAK